ncbi:CTP synthase [bacterium]|nr:CTP synthase [bacterium]
MAKNTKYIFITGGVLSGVGKGIVASSLGAVLVSRGYKVNIQKCDPYLNVDAGTLNPGEHGEVFVTDDGAETDLDLGHYERFLDRSLSWNSSLMAGYVFNKVLTQERDGKYLGKTIQIIPHITSEIQHNIIEAGKGFDIHIVEIGGTVGDYEGLHFLEAIRQMKRIAGQENVVYGHVPFLPYLETTCDVKTKPAQNSVRDLKELGISPDIIFPRSDHEITKPLIEKLSLYCDVEPEAIIPMVTAKSIYEVPLTIEKYNGTDFILNKLGLKSGKKDLKIWKQLNEKIHKKKKSVKIGLVAKYLQNKDTYLSVTESLKAAGWNNNVDVEIEWIDAEKCEDKNQEKYFIGVDGFLVPGGFGVRGIEGKINAAKFARENKVPYLGLCLGMQVASIEFARNVCGLKDANSTEFNEKTSNPVIYIMEDQKNIKKKGGTMRLGAYPCLVSPKTKVFDIYKNDKFSKKEKKGILVSERHRHRYEFNMKYRKVMEDKGFLISGTSPNGTLAEMIEIKDHPFFVATQAHPELKSRPTRPHPLFDSFLKSIVKLN